MLSQGPVLFDGAIGTYVSKITDQSNMDCEMANLNKRELVKDIHKQYLEAGCQAIKTNTFNTNRVLYHGDEAQVRMVIQAGCRIAKEAAEPYGAEVFADIGPVNGLYGDLTAAEYVFLADLFIKEGMQNFVFETLSSAEGLEEAAKHIREKVKDPYIIAMFAAQPDGYTVQGTYAEDLIKEAWATGQIDAVGLNCIAGARDMLELYQNMDLEGMTVSMMPSAGYPVVVDNRIVFDSDPEYFGSKMAEMGSSGVKIVGGCCGTTPEHMKQTKKYLQVAATKISYPARKAEETRKTQEKESRFWNKLSKGQKVIAVELDPPKDADLTKFMRGAYDLKDSGVDIVTIADCPVGRVRMDSSLLACKLEREAGLEALPHMTCRDRNVNATKALLLGLYAEGVRNVLLVTGDPIPSAERDEVKSVYQFNSRKLAAYVTSLGSNVLPSPFHIFGALNVNAHNFDIQLELAKDKEKKGVSGFLTQPVLTEEAMQNLKKARKVLRGYILGGMIPPVSAKNARFMDSEINGIKVSPDIIERYEGLEREEAEDLAVELITDIAGQIAPYVDGYYLVTPFMRTSLIGRIIEKMREADDNL